MAAGRGSDLDASEKARRAASWCCYGASEETAAGFWFYLIKSGLQVFR